MSPTRVVLVVCFTLVAGVASAQEPQWLKDARAREGQNVQEQAIRAKDGGFTARIRAKVETAEVAGEDGDYELLFDIGSATPASCEISADEFDLAAMLRAAADLTAKNLEPILGKVETRGVERTDAGVFAGAPYMAMDWLYRVNDGKAARVGGLKQFVALKNGRGIYCAHVDLGYAKSFQAAVRSLVESLQFRTPGPAPYFTEVSVASLRGQKMGLAIVTMTRDADGDTELTTSTHLAIAVTPDTLQTEDSQDIEWIRPDGSLINTLRVVSVNGEIETELQLSPEEGGKWRVSGDFNGKELDRLLDASPRPSSAIEQARARRALFGRKDVVGMQLKTAHWTSVDPTRIIESQTTIVSIIDGDRLAAREQLEGLTAEVTLEKSTGMASKTVVPVGPVTIEIERVYINGSF